MDPKLQLLFSQGKATDFKLGR